MSCLTVLFDDSSHHQTRIFYLNNCPLEKYRPSDSGLFHLCPLLPTTFLLLTLNRRTFPCVGQAGRTTISRGNLEHIFLSREILSPFGVTPRAQWKHEDSLLQILAFPPFHPPWPHWLIPSGCEVPEQVYHTNTGLYLLPPAGPPVNMGSLHWAWPIEPYCIYEAFRLNTKCWCICRACLDSMSL